jgi:hypothetical protein
VSVIQAENAGPADGLDIQLAKNVENPAERCFQLSGDNASSA